MEGPFQVIPYNYAIGWALPIAAPHISNPDCEPLISWWLHRLD